MNGKRMVESRENAIAIQLNTTQRPTHTLQVYIHTTLNGDSSPAMRATGLSARGGDALAVHGAADFWAADEALGLAPGLAARVARAVRRYPRRRA